MAMASSLDTIGYFTRNIEDAAIILQAIAGRDKHDATTSNIAPDNYLEELQKSIVGLKIGVVKEYFEVEGFDQKSKRLIDNAIKKIEELTHQSVQQVSLPHTQYALACYYIIMSAEVSSNLSRYDGIKYGLSEKAENMLSAYVKTRGIGFGDEVKRRIMLGSYALSHGYYEAYYKKALAVRTLIKKDFDEAFKKIDILLAPVTPTPAFKLGEKIDNPIQMYLSDIFTLPVNLAGLPALSLPCGKVGKLPVGLQIIGKQFDEKIILKLAYHYEQNNPSVEAGLSC